MPLDARTKHAKSTNRMGRQRFYVEPTLLIQLPIATTYYKLHSLIRYEVLSYTAMKCTLTCGVWMIIIKG